MKEQLLDFIAFNSSEHEMVDAAWKLYKTGSDTVPVEGLAIMVMQHLISENRMLKSRINILMSVAPTVTALSIKP